MAVRLPLEIDITNSEGIGFPAVFSVSELSPTSLLTFGFCSGMLEEEANKTRIKYMTVRTKNDLDKVQLYIQKLQEIKGFLQQARFEEQERQDSLDLRVNCYWNNI